MASSLLSNERENSRELIAAVEAVVEHVMHGNQDDLLGKFLINKYKIINSQHFIIMFII